MRDVLKDAMTPWPECDAINERRRQCEKLIRQMDNLFILYERIWGVNVLPELATPELKTKWDAHCNKITDAINNSNPDLLLDLLGGLERGFLAMEKAAYAAGHKPHDVGQAWTVRMPCGAELAICATEMDARVLHANCRHKIPLVIYTLEEVANLISARGVLVNMQSEQLKLKQEKTPFDFSKGDDIPI